MAINDFNLGLIGKLDGTKSKQQLNNDIVAIQKSINELQLKAKLDPNQVKSLESQLNNLKVSINNATISQSALNGMVTQINNALKGIQIGNVNIGGTANIGQQIGNNIAQGFKQSANAIESFKNSLANAGKSSSEIDNIVNKVKSLNVQIDSLRFSESTNGLMNVNVAGLDEFGNKVRITQTLLQDLQDMQWKVSNTTTSVVSTKELERINNVFTDYTAKLAQFKSTNTNILSGLTQPLADFESKLAGLKNGTVSIDEVKNAFKLLGTEASKITENFTGQLSKTDAAIRKLAQGDEIMDKLKASFKGLNNAPKEITKELNSVSKLLQNVKNIESKEGRTANWSEAYRKWANEVDKLQAKLSVLQKQQASMTTPQIFKTGELKNADIPYMTKVSNTIEKQMAEIQKMANAKGWQKFEVKGVEEADGKIKALTLTVRDAEGALKQFTMQRAKLQGSGKAQTGLMQVGDVKVLETASQAQAKLAQQTDNANAKLQEQVNKIQHSLDVGDYDTQFKTFETALKKVGIEGQELENKLNGVKTKLDELKSSATGDNIIPATVVENARLLDIEIEKISNDIKSIKLDNSLIADDIKVNDAITKLNEQIRKNSAYSSYAKIKIQSWIAELEKGDVAVSRLKEINSEAKALHHQMAAIGNIGKSKTETFVENIKSFSEWLTASGVFMEAVEMSKKLVESVFDIDTAMTNLYKVTDETDERYNKFLTSSYENARKLGRTVSSLIEQTANWSKLGYSLNEAEELAKLSSIYANVAEISDDNAVSDMVTAMKAFNIESSNAITIINALNTLGNKYATSAAELGTGLSNSASAMATAGTDMSKTLAMLTGGAEITQSAGEFGNMLKVASMRIRGMKGELEELNEEVDESVDSISKVQTQILNLTHGKVNIFDNDDEFRDYYDIMNEISEIYNTLSSTEQASLSELLFGKQRGNQGAALLQAFQSGQIQKAYEDIQNSAGSAYEEQERWLQSLEAKIQQFESAFQALSNTILDSDLLKYFVDLGTTGVKSVNELVNALTPLGTLAITLGSILGASNLG